MAKSPFASEAMDRFFEELKGRFDLIILDTPSPRPGLAYSGACPEVDQTPWLCLCAGARPRTRAVRAAIHESRIGDPLITA